jgi:peroxiredoxin
MVRVIKIIMLVSIIVSGLAVAGCSSGAAPSPVLGVGSPAPDFQLQSLDGKMVTLSSLRGRPVMLNFWATWCAPCRVEMPFIQGVFEDDDWAEQGLVILAVNLGEPPSKVKSFMEDNGLSFTVLLDADQSVARDYNIRGIPTTYFIDKNGIIRDMKIGPFAKKAEIDWRLVNSIMEAD